jgi:hypothetical protein
LRSRGGGWLSWGRALDAQQFGHLSHQFLGLRPSDGRLSHQDGVDPVLDADLPPGLFEDAPGPVALDCTTHAAGGYHCKSPRPGREKQYHRPCVEGSALCEHPSNVG